jgi:hypothetical protein
MTDVLRKLTGWVISLSNLFYSLFVFSRWEAQDTWYKLFAICALLGGILFMVCLLWPSIHRRVLTVALIFVCLGGIGQIDACAFFIIMRIPFDTMDIIQFVLPPSALLYYVLLGFFGTKKC